MYLDLSEFEPLFDRSVEIVRRESNGYHYHMSGNGMFDFLDPKKNGVFKAFDPNQNGIRDKEVLIIKEH